MPSLCSIETQRISFLAPGAPPGSRQELRHDEERDPLHPFRRVGRAREDEVHDVLRQVVLPPRNEDLGAANSVMIAFAHRARAHRGQVRARLRLGQVHGAGPRPRGELSEVGRLLLRRAVNPQRLEHPRGEHRGEAQRHVRALPDLLDRRRDEVRQALTPVLGLPAEAVPAGLDELAVRLLEPGRSGDLAVGKPRALLVAPPVQGIEHIPRELRGLAQHRFHQFGVDLGVAGERGNLGEPREFRDRELHVLQRGGVGGHARLQSSWVSSGTALKRSSTSQ